MRPGSARRGGRSGGPTPFAQYMQKRHSNSTTGDVKGENKNSGDTFPPLSPLAGHLEQMAPRRPSSNPPTQNVLSMPTLKMKTSELLEFIEKQREELQVRTDSVNAIQRNFERLSEMYCADRAELEQLREEAQKWRMSDKEAGSERKVFAALREEFADLVKAHKKLKEQREQEQEKFRHDYETAKSESAALQQRLDTQQALEAQSRREYETLCRAHKDLQSSHETLQCRLRELTESTAQQQRAHKDLERTCEELRRNLHAQQQRHESLYEELQRNLQQEVQHRLRSEADSAAQLRGVAEDREAQLRRVAAELKAAAASVVQFRTEIHRRVVAALASRGAALTGGGELQTAIRADAAPRDIITSALDTVYDSVDAACEAVRRGGFGADREWMTAEIVQWEARQRTAICGEEAARRDSLRVAVEAMNEKCVNNSREAQFKAEREKHKRREVQFRIQQDEQKRREAQFRIEQDEYKSREAQFINEQDEHKRREIQFKNEQNEHKRREAQFRNEQAEQKRREAQFRIEKDERKRREAQFRIEQDEYKSREAQFINEQDEHKRREEQLRNEQDELKRREIQFKNEQNEHKRREAQFRNEEDEQKRREAQFRNEQDEQKRREAQFRDEQDAHKRREEQLRNEQDEHQCLVRQFNAECVEYERLKAQREMEEQMERSVTEAISLSFLEEQARAELEAHEHDVLEAYAHEHSLARTCSLREACAVQSHTAHVQELVAAQRRDLHTARFMADIELRVGREESAARLSLLFDWASDLFSCRVALLREEAAFALSKRRRSGPLGSAAALSAAQRLLDAEAAAESAYSCGLCFALYKRPLTCAPCGHTFCEGCLLGHPQNLAAAAEARQTGLVRYCPECRFSACNTVVRVPVLQRLSGNFEFREKAAAELARILAGIEETNVK